MTNQHELGRMRSVALSPYDINVLGVMVKTGGEFPFYIERVAPEHRDQHVAGMRSLVDRGIVEIDQARSSPTRWMLRLTPSGHAVCAQLEAMNAKPRVEVQMHGDSPEVVKS